MTTALKKGFWIVFEDYETAKDAHSGIREVLKTWEIVINGETIIAHEQFKGFAVSRSGEDEGFLNISFKYDEQIFTKYDLKTKDLASNLYKNLHEVLLEEVMLDSR